MRRRGMAVEPFLWRDPKPSQRPTMRRVAMVAKLAAAFAVAGCTTIQTVADEPSLPPMPRSTQAVTIAAQSVATSAMAVVGFDASWRLWGAAASGIEQVFDDGEATYLVFGREAPSTLMLFDGDGKAVKWRAFERFAVIEGVPTGVLIRTSTDYSYAQTRGGKSQPAGVLPPDLASQRAIILEAQARVAKLAERAAAAIPATSPAELAAISRELDEVQAVIDGVHARIARIYFPTGSAEIALSPTARAELAASAKSAASIAVRGRTDSAGSVAANARVARARAQAARTLLIELGVARDRIRVEQPVRGDYLASNDDAAGRARNRRVEIAMKSATAATDVEQPAAPGGTGRARPSDAKAPRSPSVAQR